MYIPAVIPHDVPRMLPRLGTTCEAVGAKQPAQVQPAGSFEVSLTFPIGHRWPDVPDWVGDIARRPALVFPVREEEVSGLRSLRTDLFPLAALSF